MANKLQGTFEEAIGFLTNPTTGRVAWTDLTELDRICHVLTGKRSIEEVQEDDLRHYIRVSLAVLDFARPIPADFEGGWNDWLVAFLADDPEIQILLFEEAIIIQQSRVTDRDEVNPSIITSAIS